MEFLCNLFYCTSLAFVTCYDLFGLLMFNFSMKQLGDILIGMMFTTLSIDSWLCDHHFLFV